LQCFTDFLDPVMHLDFLKNFADFDGKIDCHQRRDSPFGAVSALPFAGFSRRNLSSAVFLSRIPSLQG
jgi:hypothetical protein